jgi:hypothetical protein
MVSFTGCFLVFGQLSSVSLPKAEDNYDSKQVSKLIILSEYRSECPAEWK